MEKLTLNREGRLDNVLSEELDISRTKAQSIIESGVFVDGKKVTKAGYQVNIGNIVKYTPLEIPVSFAKPAQVDMKIIYEDDYIFVIDKPRGVVVHPAPGHHNDTIVNGLAYINEKYGEYLENEEDSTFYRPGIVHRIDKDTSGLLIVAKDDETSTILTDMISRHEVDREYLAIVYGRPSHNRFKVDAPIARSKYNRLKMCVEPIDGKSAITHFTVYGYFNEGALVRAKLETGRTHQIRVHLAYSHLPIVGDVLYGRKLDRSAEEGQCLHAFKLSFTHPITREQMTFYSPVDEYFKAQLRRLCQ